MPVRFLFAETSSSKVCFEPRPSKLFILPVEVLLTDWPACPVANFKKVTLPSAVFLLSIMEPPTCCAWEWIKNRADTSRNCQRRIECDFMFKVDLTIEWKVLF